MAIGKVGGTSHNQGIMMPTHDQLVAAYSSIVDGALKGGKGTAMKHAPANAEKYAHYDITKKGVMGAKQEVYVIKGELYLKSTPVTQHPHSSWTKIGPAPMF
jgi:hypothetical protein